MLKYTEEEKIKILQAAENLADLMRIKERGFVVMEVMVSTRYDVVEVMPIGDGGAIRMKLSELEKEGVQHGISDNGAVSGVIKSNKADPTPLEK